MIEFIYDSNGYRCNQQNNKRGDTMKAINICKQILMWLIILLLAVPPGVVAQDSASSAQPQPAQFSIEELDALLAPIALYPDSLMIQILMASTYPLEVVQATRWLNENKDLKDDQLDAVLQKKDWDPSVKSLVPFPQVLSMMNEKLEWTQKLGNAFLSQQEDVMDSVQRLRAKAYAAGNFATTKEQKVIVEETVETQIIRVEPVTQVVYVPFYDPTVVYGVWAYPAYPPYYYYPPGYFAATSAFWFTTGVFIGAAWYGGVYWGHHHHNHKITVNHNYNYNRPIPPRPPYSGRPGTPHGRPVPAPQTYGQGIGNTSTWQHNPQHRKGVQYPNQATAQRYSQSNDINARTQQNMRARGYGQAGISPQQPGTVQRSQQPGTVQRSQQPGTVQRSQQPGTVQRSQQPGTVQRSQQPGTVQRSQQPGTVQRSQQPGTVQRSQQPGTVQRSQQPGAVQRSQQPGTVQRSQQPGTVQRPQQPGAFSGIENGARDRSASMRGQYSRGAGSFSGGGSQRGGTSGGSGKGKR